MDLLETLPKTLVTSNGTTIANAEKWESERRPEIIELFRECVFGREPIGSHASSLSFNVETEGEAMGGLALRRKVRIGYAGEGGEGEIGLLLFIPLAARKPVPAFVLINNRGVEHSDPDRNTSSKFWPAERIVARGYAAAVFSVDDVDPDEDDGFRNGVHGIFDEQGKPRAADAWGTIAAWAWGASRIMDYLETDELIDARSVALVGHSRGGKTALWAGAQDTRFAMVVSNNSGCTGAALSRIKRGESVKAINDSFPHWFNANYKRYNEREEELPVDQHMLLALIAPRLLYVASATEDEWADPSSEFQSTVLAAESYRLFGLSGLGVERFPAADTPVLGEGIGYHLRTGEHDLTDYDWQCFIDFADANHWRK